MEVYSGRDVGEYKTHGTKTINGVECCLKCGKPLKRRLSIGGTEIEVGVLCDCQAAEYEERRARHEADERRIRIDRLRSLSLMSGPYAKASFDNYTIRDGNRKAYEACRSYAERFQELKKRGYGLMLCGPVGTGKSYTAACICNALIEMEYTVMMTSLPKILEVPGWKDEGKSEVFCEPDLLVIDDFGVERSTEYSLERAYEVIDTRVRSCKPLIITTNLSVSEIVNEDNIGRRRIYDRILEGCVPLMITGSSFRKEKAMRNQKELMRILSETSSD